MKIKHFFQKGYYLNLDRRVDRRVHFDNEMARVGLSDFFERVSSEDSINEEDPVKKHCYCSLTYHKLFSRIYEEGYDNVLIFEDDAYFYDGGHRPGIEIVEKALDDLEKFPDWQMIYFGGHPIREVFEVSENLYMAPTILTTHAVGYKRSVIKRVLDEYKPFNDSAIDGWYGQRHDIVKYLVNPIAVGQIEGVSDLDAWGKSVNIFTFLESYKKVKKQSFDTF